MKIDDHIYAYLWDNPQVNNCNSYLIRGDVPILIDVGHQQFVGYLLDSIKLDGISQDEIKLIVSTHGHPDHLEGLPYFLKEPLLMAISKKEEAYLKEFGSGFYRMMGMEMPVFRTDFYLKEGELFLGNERFEVIETPGHSPGSICLYWPSKGALFTGDVVFSMGVGRTDFPGGDGRLLKESIERLEDLDVEILLPGHGSIVVGRERVQRNFGYIKNAFLS